MTEHENDSCTCGHFRKFHETDRCVASALGGRCACQRFELSVTVDGRSLHEPCTCGHERKSHVNGEKGCNASRDGRGVAPCNCQKFSSSVVDDDVPEPEAINHPAHYGGKDDLYEAIKVIEAWKLGFNIGNTVKYISRAGKKPGSSTVEDLRKAAFYLAREISNLETESKK